MKTLDIVNKIDNFIHKERLINLNQNLIDINIELIFNNLNNLSIEDFEKLKKNKIKNKILLKLTSGKIINKESNYIENKIIYNKKIDFNFKNEIFDNLIKRENVKLSIKSNNLIKNMLTTNFDNFLEDYQNSKNISYNGYDFNKNCFSNEFNEKFLDWKKHINIYSNHPRISKEQLQIELEKIINTEKDLSNLIIIEFNNFYIELEKTKEKNAIT